jgi:iron complex outermembrane receptor protein
MNNSRTKLACAVAVATSAIATGASAQLEEVIVTAQKRLESAQDIPMAISAYGSDELKAMDAKGFGAIVLLTPGLSGSADADTQAVLTVRGIGTAAFSPGADNSVGTYFNEIPVSRNIGGMGYLDVERIEVVKGPQGTLFGRNTSSGAISITNQFALVGEDTLDLRASGGDEGQALYEGIGNYSVTDNLAFRAAVRHDQRDGTYKNGVTGDELNGRDHDQGRVGLTWDATDDLTVNWYWEKYKVNNRWQMISVEGLGGNDAYDDTVFVNAEPKQKIDSDFSVLKLNYDLDESMSITSNSGYYNSNITALPTDADTIDVPIVDFIEPWKLKQYTQEFRLNVAGERVNWFVGGSYYYEEAEATTIVTLYEDPGLDVLFEDEGLCMLAEDFGLSCGVHQEDSAAKNKTTSYAIFGDVAFDITDRLKATVGARYTQEQKEMKLNTPLQDSTTVALITEVAGGPNNALFTYTPGEISEKDNWDSFDPRVAVDYIVGEDSMIYANYAKGFKSGGFNRQPTEPGGNNILSFDPEENNAYEIGFKTDFLDQHARLNISAFYYDYSDFQLETNTGFQLEILNVSDLETSGIEIDTTLLVGDNLDFRLAYAYLDTEFKGGELIDPDGNVTDLQGNNSIRSPENTFSLTGTWNITDQIDARVAYAYTDEMYFTAANTEELKADDYHLINARLDWISSDQTWGVSLIGDNLGDEEYITSMIDLLLPVQQPGYGRSYRAEVRYSFF